MSHFSDFSRNGNTRNGSQTGEYELEQGRQRRLTYEIILALPHFLQTERRSKKNKLQEPTFSPRWQACALLQFLIMFSTRKLVKRGMKPGDRFYCKIRTIERELRMSPQCQKREVKFLLKKGLIFCKRYGKTGKRHFRIDWNNLEIALERRRNNIKR